jgi:hypothetical protein
MLQQAQTQLCSKCQLQGMLGTSSCCLCIIVLSAMHVTQSSGQKAIKHVPYPLTVAHSCPHGACCCWCQVDVSVEGQQQQLDSQQAGCEVLVQVVVGLVQKTGQEVEPHLQQSVEHCRSEHQ